MAFLSRMGRQRGSIAVEFALVTPMFLALIGAVFYFGLALYTRLLVLSAANTAVRSCVIKQVGFNSDDLFKNCAREEFMQLTGSSGAFAVTCNGGTPQLDATSMTLSNGKLQSNVKVLSLKLTCNVTMGSLMWMSGPDSGPGTVPLQIATAMPYSLTRLSN